MVLFFYGLNIPAQAVPDNATIASKAFLTKFQIRMVGKKSVRCTSGVMTMNTGGGGGASFLEKL